MKRESTMPFIDPRTSDPKALAYRKGIEARKYTPPVGGGPLPPIPHLAQAPPDDGPPMTMAEHAMRARMPAAAPVQEMPVQSNAPSITQTDLLPESAKQDPQYREGAGSGYAANQPHLALKYGVIRNGMHIPPQALRPQEGKRTLSEKTIKGLEEVVKFQKQRQDAETSSAVDLKAESAAIAGPAGAAARLGNMAGDDDPKPLSKEDKKELTESALRKMDDFDFDTFRQMMMKDLLNNQEQRDIIEERLTPMDIGDLIVEGSVAQEVVIVPGKFWLVFRSVSGEDDLAVKRMLMQEAKTIQVDDRYYLDKFAFMTLTIGLDSICGNPLPSHRVNGHFDEDAFWKKFEFVSGLNNHMIASLGVNYFWFDVRVRKLVVAERVKNG